MNSLQFRPTWAEIDLAAIRNNVSCLRDIAAPAKVCVAVKANGYGHGAVKVAEAALKAGATWLGVALVEEGIELRLAGITAPILIFSEAPLSSINEVIKYRLTPTVYTYESLEAIAKASSGLQSPVPIHIKVDSGMHRVGASPGDVKALVRQAGKYQELVLEGVYTHLAVADEPANPFTSIQIDRFLEVLEDLAADGVRPQLVHACNSAATIAHPEAHFNLVRCGISVYGPGLGNDIDRDVALQPALSLKSRVSFVKTVAAGESVSYGLLYRLNVDSRVATIPIGYGDGVPRRLGKVGGEVLIRGQRRPIAGTITMDQILVDCGDSDVEVGDEVVLLGNQGGGSITAREWADKLDTIVYEIDCAISSRVPQVFLNE